MTKKRSLDENLQYILGVILELIEVTAR